MIFARICKPPSGGATLSVTVYGPQMVAPGAMVPSETTASAVPTRVEAVVSGKISALTPVAVTVVLASCTQTCPVTL